MKVAMVGCAPTWKDAPFADPRWEIWAHCSGQAAIGSRRVTRWFDLHQLEIWRQGKVWYQPQPEGPETYVAWLASRRQPVYMQEHWPIVPTSVAYPLRDVVKAFGIVPDAWQLDPSDPLWWAHVKDRGEFSSTFAYMLALALYEGVEEVALYGIDFCSAQEGPTGLVEYRDQRPGAKYWVGVARGMGVPVTVAQGSWFEHQAALYGYAAPRMDHSGLCSARP